MTELASLFVWRRDGVVVVAVTGEVDISNAERLEREILREIDGSALVLDLGGLSFLDGAGVHLLYSLAAHQRSRGLGFALVVRRGSPVRRLLEMAGPEPLQWSYSSEDAAIAAVTARSP